MKKLTSWLFYSSSPLESITDEKLDDCIFVIAQDAFYVYCTKDINPIISKLCIKIPNVIYYCLRTIDAKDSDRAEIIKVGEFYKMIHDKAIVGIPLAEPDLDSDFYYDRNEKDFVNKVVESWPLVQAYALEGIGSSFFSIKHKLINIRGLLSEVYTRQDSYTMASLLNSTVVLMEGAWEQCFGIFSRVNLSKRLDMTEADLAAELYLPYELAFLSFDSTDLGTFERSDKLSHPRVLVGKNTNNIKTARSSTQPRIEYHNGKRDPPFHFVCEGVDYHTSARWVRTYFLNNLIKNYMKGIEYSHKTDPLKGTRADIIESDINLIYTLYNELIIAFSLLLEKINKGDIKDLVEAKTLIYQSFCNTLKELKADIKTIDSSNIDISLISYNSLGQVKKVYEVLDIIKDWSLYVLRVQVTHIKSVDDEDLGGISYADSFIFLDENELIVITKSIPQIQGWFTSFKHYPLMNYNPEHVYLLEQPQFGKQLVKYETVSGVIPLDKFFGNQNELLIRGDIILYEHGLKLKDQRFYIIHVLYTEIKEFKFIATDIFTLEILFKEKERLPLPKHNKGKLIIIMPMEFIKDVCYKYFIQLNDKVSFGSSIEISCNKVL